MNVADKALLALEARGLNDHADTLREVIETYRKAHGEAWTRIAVLTTACRELLAELHRHIDDPSHRTPIQLVNSAARAMEQHGQMVRGGPDGHEQLA